MQETLLMTKMQKKRLWLFLWAFDEQIFSTWFNLDGQEYSAQLLLQMVFYPERKVMGCKDNNFLSVVILNHAWFECS